jgi:glycosyltransferase involved in cell wall biosynthesis
VSNIKISVFFTYDYSIETLEESGLLEREMRIYRKIYQKYGFEFLFFTYDKELVSKVKDFPEFEFIPIYKYVKISNNKIIRFLKSFIIPFKLKKYLKNTDIVYQHQLLGAWIPIIIKFLLKKPLQIRTGYDAYLFSLENNDHFYKTLFYKYLTKAAIKYSDLYTVTSMCDKNFLSKEFDAKNIKVVPNWIDISKLQPVKRAKHKILMIGRLEIQKNYPVAFDFLEIADSNIEIDIYGSGSKLSELESLSSKKNLKVNFLGNLSHEALMNEMPKYKYFLTTSLYEGNPKTVLEALSSKCIVFASDIKNHEEIITDGVNGFLFSDAHELYEKYKFISNNLEFFNLIKQNTINSLTQNNISHVAEEMSDSYKSLTSLK